LLLPLQLSLALRGSKSSRKKQHFGTILVGFDFSKNDPLNPWDADGDSDCGAEDKFSYRWLPGPVMVPGVGMQPERVIPILWLHTS